MSHRAVPPFDGEHFAANMMGISVSCFLPLMNGFSKAGRLETDRPFCRYEGEDRIVDVVVHQDDTWEIGTYANRRNA